MVVIAHGLVLGKAGDGPVDRTSGRGAFRPLPVPDPVALREGVLLFDRNTGDRLDDKLGPMPQIRDLDRAFFSPDGKSVVIDPAVDLDKPEPGHGQPKTGRRLFAVPLKLTPAGTAAATKPPPARPASVPAKHAPAVPDAPADDVNHEKVPSPA